MSRPIVVNDILISIKMDLECTVENNISDGSEIY